MSSSITFNLDGTISRKLRKPCQRCGAVEICGDCWGEYCDWSPFGIWHCLLCRMPTAVFDGGIAPVRCGFCGWDEATECTTVQ
jgi:hypothetical protein